MVIQDGSPDRARVMDPDFRRAAGTPLSPHDRHTRPAEGGKLQCRTRGVRRCTLLPAGEQAAAP